MTTIQIATGRIDYRPNSTSVVIDTTIKSAVGGAQIYAPTWEMVMGSKKGTLPWEDYTSQYFALIEGRDRRSPDALIAPLRFTQLNVLACYCRDTSQTTCHCHRYLLVAYLQSIVSGRFGITFEYVGEVVNRKTQIDQQHFKDMFS